MQNSQKQTLIQILFVDLKNQPFKSLYHEVRKSGEKYALSAGNSDAQGLGVWIKQPAGTHLDIVVKHPITKKMIPVHQYIIVPDKKGKMRIQAPFYIEEKVKLQPREGEQGDYLRKTHTVKKGETLTSIAKHYGTDWQILFQLNRDKIKDPDKIGVGETIKIPPKNSGHRSGTGTNNGASSNAPPSQTSGYSSQSGMPSRTKTPTTNTPTNSEDWGYKLGSAWNTAKDKLESGIEWLDKTTQPVQDAVVDKFGEIKEGIENAVSSHGTRASSTQPSVVTPIAQPAPQSTNSPVQQHNPVSTTNVQQRGQTETPKIVSTTTGNCVCQTYDLIWSGHPNVTCEFRKKVVEISKDLWPENYLQMANNLMALMHLETAGTFSPSKDNGKGYYGLIQFGEEAAIDLKTTTGYLRKLSAVEQLDWVKNYFKLYNRYQRINSFVEMYLTILYPKVVTGRMLTDNDVVFDYQKKAYRNNPAFMKEQGERKLGGFSRGVTYVWEVKQEIKHHYKEGEKSVNREFKSGCNNSVRRPLAVNSDIIIINIKRTLQNKECTIGELRINKFNFSCYCLERPGPDTITPNMRKRIPTGVYSVKKHKTRLNKELGWAFVLFNEKVPASRYILIHIGNYPKNTDGCILLGTSKGNNSVHNSTSAIKQFYGLFENIAIDKIKIQIEDDYK